MKSDGGTGVHRRQAVLGIVGGFAYAARQPALASTQEPYFPVSGGPIDPNDKDKGGGAREASWSSSIAAQSEPGESLILAGTVYDATGRSPREGVTVYAYHTDDRGFYRKKLWGPPRLRGWTRTNADGRYEFSTIKPGSYPMRSGPAHIHMTVSVPGMAEWWIPELRFSGDPLLTQKEIDLASEQGQFASVRPIESAIGGRRTCVRDIRLPQGW